MKKALRLRLWVEKKENLEKRVEKEVNQKLADQRGKPESQQN